MSRDTVRWPFGAADSQSKTFAATVTATISNSLTQLTIGQMTADATLNLTNSSELTVGDKLIIKTSADSHSGGWTLTFGTGIDGAALNITASKSWIIEAHYDGSIFLVVSAKATN